MNNPRYLPTGSLLTNEDILVTGGAAGTDSFLSNSELYDLSTGTWTVGGIMNYARELHMASTLLNGKVLVTEGINTNEDLTSAELYNPSKTN